MSTVLQLATPEEQAFCAETVREFKNPVRDSQTAAEMAMTCRRRLDRANQAIARLQQCGMVNGKICQRRYNARRHRRVSRWIRESCRDLHLVAFRFNTWTGRCGDEYRCAIQDAKGNWWLDSRSTP